MAKTPIIDNPFGGRSVEEWIGAHPDVKVPDRIRDRVFARARGVCHLSGRKIQAGERWDIEHIKQFPGFDEGTALAWFAGALMRGFDEASIRATRSSSKEA